MTQVVYLKKGTTKVYVSSAKVEEVLSNILIKVQRPQSKTTQNSKNPGTLFVDIKKIEHMFNIQGYLDATAISGNAGLSWSGGTMTTANHVRLALIKDILYNSGDIELYYRNYKDLDYGSYYGTGESVDGGNDHIKCQLDKINISDVSLRADVSSNAVERYNISLSLTRGKVK